MKDPDRDLRLFEGFLVAGLLGLILWCVVGIAWGSVIIVDENGRLIRQCESPVELIPDQGGIICRTPTKIYNDGFE